MIDFSTDDEDTELEFLGVLYQIQLSLERIEISLESSRETTDRLLNELCTLVASKNSE